MKVRYEKTAEGSCIECSREPAQFKLRNADLIQYLCKYCIKALCEDIGHELHEERATPWR